MLSALLAPTGYMIQDSVADAMTVEAVPRVDEDGKPYDEATRKSMHTTMQTLGRVAIIGGLALVAAANIYMFHGTEDLSREAKAALYANVYTAALVIPVISVLRRACCTASSSTSARPVEKTRPNWAVLGGSLVFVAITLAVGLGGVPYARGDHLRRLARDHRVPAVATGARARAGGAQHAGRHRHRAVPLPRGAAAPATAHLVDDRRAQVRRGVPGALSLLAYALTLVGMFVLRGFMAEHSIATIVVVLSVAAALLALPIIGMFYGLHEWTAAHTGGMVDARVIMLFNTALESPLGQIAMMPMLAWIANSAPANLKATYFAVMASFTNLALAASQLGTVYLNRVFVVKRGDYSELGELMITAAVLTLLLPLVAVAGVRLLRLRTA